VALLAKQKAIRWDGLIFVGLIFVGSVVVGLMLLVKPVTASCRLKRR